MNQGGNVGNGGGSVGNAGGQVGMRTFGDQ